LVVFAEGDLTFSPLAYPTFPLAEQVAGWVREAQRRSGTDLNMGFKLYRTLLDAGLVEPRIRAWAPSAAPPDFGLSDLVAATVRSLLPRIIEHGIASAEEVDIETLSGRLRAELAERRAIWMGPLYFDAWARKP
jgi:hypothetical protein